MRVLDNNTHPFSPTTLCVSIKQDDFGILETSPVVTFTQGFNHREHHVALGVPSSHGSLSTQGVCWVVGLLFRDFRR